MEKVNFGKIDFTKLRREGTSRPKECKCDICGDIGTVFVDGIAHTCICQLKKYEDIRKAKSLIPLKDVTVKGFVVSNYVDRKTATIARDAVVQYVKNIEKVNGKGLYIYSKTKGSGKTHLVCAIGNALCAAKNVKFYTTIQLLNMLKGSFQIGNTQEIIQKLKDVSILILDDIGAEKPTDWVNSTLFDILDTRMVQKKITIFTSNCKQDELRLDDRISSRIKSMSIEIAVPEEDIRNKLCTDKKAVENIIFG